MFAKTVLSCLVVAVTIIGLLMYFDAQDATVFTIGIISYFFIAFIDCIFWAILVCRGYRYRHWYGSSINESP